LSIPDCEVEIGIETYATKTKGIGGKIRVFPKDFVVKETLINGSVACDNVQLDRSGEGEHLVCVLKKEKWDTLLAIREIARNLKVGLRRIRFAGIKDKDALTYQFISIWNISPTEVRRLRINGIELIPFAFSRKPISINELLGNYFHITIRDIENEAIDLVRYTSYEMMELGGAPNFFGHQRFGIRRPVTHLVGRCIIRGEFEEAVKTYLAYSKFEAPRVRYARRALSEDWDFERAIQNFPKNLIFERTILRKLSVRQDFVGALRGVPNRLVRLFVQAYQSYLFNRILSRRIRLGIPINEAQIGDYVVKTNENSLPSDEITTTNESNIMHVNSELKSGKASLVIPLMGFNTVFSGGVQGEIERKVLEEEKIELKDFLIKEMPELSQVGGFRTAVAPIGHLNFSEIFKDKQDAFSPGALLLNFDLLKGSYATIVLREFMKPSDPILSGF